MDQRRLDAACAMMDGMLPPRASLRADASEANIVHEIKNWYVIKCGKGWYEVRRNSGSGTHSTVEGTIKNEDDAQARAKAIQHCDRRARYDR